MFMENHCELSSQEAQQIAQEITNYLEIDTSQAEFVEQRNSDEGIKLGASIATGRRRYQKGFFDDTTVTTTDYSVYTTASHIQIQHTRTQEFWGLTSREIWSGSIRRSMHPFYTFPEQDLAPTEEAKRVFTEAKEQIEKPQQNPQ